MGGDGGKGGKDDGGDNKSGDLAGQIALDYYKKTDPMRQNMIGNFQNFMDGGYDVSQNPVWGAGRGVVEDQYDVAKQNVIGTTPKGGALSENLADVEMDRAKSLGDMGARVSQDEYNKAYTMATGVPQQAMGTLSTLAGNQAMANAQTKSGKFGALGDLGMGAGYMFGSK